MEDGTEIAPSEEGMADANISTVPGAEMPNNEENTITGILITNWNNVVRKVRS